MHTYHKNLCFGDLPQAIPLYHSFHTPDVLTADQIKSLPSLLATKVGHDAFCKFLQSEYSLENLFFWKEVRCCLSVGYFFAMFVWYS